MKFVTLFMVVAVFQEVVHSMTWEKVIDGNIPKDTIGSFTPKIYFCKVYDEASKQTFTGSIKEGENACQYVELTSGDIRFSDSSFQVLRGSKEEWEWEWTYKTAEMPQNVVKCSDKHKEGCYLG